MLKVFVCLLLAHVLSDFVLQTNFVYKLKTKSKIGLYLHVATFFLLSFLFCLPSSYNLYFFIWLGFVSVSHYFIDKIKLFFQRNIIQKELIHFYADQSIHVLILCSLFLFFQDINGSSFLFEMIQGALALSTKSAILLFFTLSFSVYISYGISVVLYYYDRTVDLQVEKLKHNYFSMFVRVMIFLLLASKFFWLGILLGLFVRQVLKKRLIYDGRRFVIEVLTLFVFLIMFLPIKYMIVGF
ncbi:MAG: DUF3307 domain-containing protein [Candidatus Margulisbacteria bacterium]|nr:DUF3307 domain-containing protein [Candidatus Margulisiibacteriota bacterium]